MKTIEFFRVVPLGKLCWIFCYLFHSTKKKVSHYGGRRDLSFTEIKFDIILMGLKIPTWYYHCSPSIFYNRRTRIPRWLGREIVVAGLTPLVFICRIKFSHKDVLLHCTYCCSFSQSKYFTVNKKFWENWAKFKIQNLPILWKLTAYLMFVLYE